MKISIFKTLFQEHLSPLYEQREVDAVFFTYLEDKFDIKKHQYFLNPAMDVACNAPITDLEWLSKGCPIQYVTGKTIFYGLPLEVSPSVLIPRPETEELVEHILCSKFKVQSLRFKVSPPNFGGVPEGRGGLHIKILDICTGSGAIAIALAKNVPNAHVWATDISVRALETAQRNADRNNVKITFLHHDILKDDRTMLPCNLDIVVSNPPYIPQNERNSLHKNIGYEPENALFVPDGNPLVFYAAIAGIAKKNLRAGGVLFFETHDKFHHELSAILTEKGFKKIELWNDINGKPRFVSCKKL